MLGDWGEKARAYAGGTELLLAMKHDLLRYEHLIDVKTVPDLNKIELKNGSIIIGSTTTHRAIERSPVVRENLPILAHMTAQVANVRVRASGTLGGNLCFAEPHSDPATLLLALGAKAQVHGKGGARKLGIDQLIIGAYETSLAPDEILSWLEIPLPTKSQRAAYMKFQLHERPTLSLALIMDVEGDHIKRTAAVVGSVGAVPTQSPTADTLLTGAKAQVESKLSEAAAALAEAAEPVDDLEGSADYKRHLVGVFLKRAFHQALA
jgi:carbon-monoxide dehydrogenase medium subunit